MPRKVAAAPKSGITKTARAKKTVSNKETTILPKQDLLSQIKIDLKHKNETQKKLTQSIKTGDVTVCIGPAGTGKTLLSVAEALLLLKTNPDKYHDIKLVKSIVQLKDEDLGTLPGDEKDKLKFIMMSFLDAFYQLIGEELTEKMIEVGYIKMEVFGSVRGRSIPNCILLFDEFQNVNDGNAKTFLTRFSENTKVIILGDANQIDLKKPESSSLAELVRMVKLLPEEQGVSVIEFDEEDIVRHRLTKFFVKLFEHPEYKKKARTVSITDKPTPPSSQIINEGGSSFFKKLIKFFSK
jgi:phosphate starvation-inducible PhoH-like protein